MQELSLNILDIAENSVSAGATRLFYGKLRAWLSPSRSASFPRC